VLQILTCPDCGGTLQGEAGGDVECASCGRSFTLSGPILDLLPTTAEHIEDEAELFELMKSGVSAGPVRSEWARSKDAFLDAVRSGVQSAAGLRIAHVGCGIDQFAGSFDDASLYVSLDITLPMLERIEPTSNTNRLLVRGDVQHLPFADGSFDVIMCIDLLHHFSSRGIARPLGELTRCLKPGGLLFVEEVNRLGLFRLPIAWAPLAILRPLRRLKRLRRPTSSMPARYEAPLSLRHVQREACVAARNLPGHLRLLRVHPCVEYPNVSNRSAAAFRWASSWLPNLAKHFGYHWFAVFERSDSPLSAETARAPLLNGRLSGRS
jgi:ubiquinone/menaquinone biosynthesis C-methylase UbiE